MWLYYLLKLFSKIVCLLPVFLQNALASLLGWLFWLATPKKRKILAVSQVRDCLGVDDAEARRIARDSVLRLGEILMTVLCFPILTEEKVKKNVIIKDPELLKELYAEGKGVIMVTAHFGNWELVPAAASANGYPLAVVVKKQSNEALNRFINEYRSMIGSKVVYHRTGVLEMLRLLNKGYGLALLSDQHAGKDGIPMDFFGKPTSCPRGPATLARITGAPMSIALMCKRPDGMHEITLQPPIYVEHTDDKEKDIRDATVVIMKKLEDEIRKNPEMWYWLHNRWKPIVDLSKRAQKT